MYGPVLPDPVLLSHPGPKERHCCESHHRENTSHSYHSGPQFPGTLDGAAVLLYLVLIIIGAVAQEISLTWLPLSPLSSLSWTCTTAMAPRSQLTSCTCSWRRSGTLHCRLTKSLLASLPHSTATPGGKPITTSLRVSGLKT